MMDLKLSRKILILGTGEVKIYTRGDLTNETK